MLILGLAVRFIHFALFEGTLLSPQFYAVDAVVCLIFGYLGFRATRAAQMTTQYSWINAPGGLHALERAIPGKDAEYRVTFRPFGASIGPEAVASAAWPDRLMPFHQGRSV